MAENNLGDILGQITNQQGQVDYTKLADEQKDIQKAILVEVTKISQSMASDRRASGRSDTPFRDRANQKQQDSFQNLFGKGKGRSSSILDSFEEALMDSLMGPDFKKNLGQALGKFAEGLGLDLSDIRGSIGKKLAGYAKDNLINQQALGDFKAKMGSRLANSKHFKDFANIFNSGVPGGSQMASQAASQMGQQATARMASQATAQAGTQIASQAGATVAGTGAAGAGAAGAAGSAGLLSTIGSLAAALGPLIVVVVAVVAVMNALGDAIEGTTALYNAAKKAMDRENASRKANLKDAQARLEADVKSYIEEPFNILKEAAEEVYQVWDAQLRKITATQGYDKAGMQELMSDYAQRLRAEGLTDVINTAAITENLSKVIDAGLSGRVAEEFAFIATKLEAAIPTQDFFGLASTYSSIAANAIRSGKSQEEAIGMANAQLEQFASNVLYSSRQLAGGFSTGLKDAGDMFTDAVKISQAAKTGDATRISGVLTAVAANVGAIAPDLATELIGAVVKAATGGNTSEIVALRSLSGMNASNTEFLKQLATNPQALFTTIFRNLGSMQNLAPGAYMEVAEGVSKVFGLSMDSFARVDFVALADTVSRMQVNQATLDENIELLKSGETTLTAEQMRNRQINEYMIDQGLAYVLDNAVSRSIQEHMWQEQIARENREATYGVELQGAALEFLSGISQTVTNLLNILNPFSWIGKIVTLAKSVDEANALRADIREVVKQGVVGVGNYSDLYNLTTTNQDLRLTDNYLELMGYFSDYRKARANTQGWINRKNQQGRNITAGVSLAMLPVAGIASLGGAGLAALAQSGVFNSWVQNAAGGAKISDHSWDNRGSLGSHYSWGSISKSDAKFLGALASAVSGGGISGGVGSAIANSAAANRVAEMLTDEYLGNYESFEDWLASGKNLGIQNVSEALKSAGYDEANVRQVFEHTQAQKAHDLNVTRIENEDAFWKQGKEFWETQVEKDTAIIDILTGIQTSWITWNEDWTKFHSEWQNYFQDWTRYFIEHTYYSAASGIDIKAIQAEEKKQEGQAIYALADALSGNIEGLKDPTVQTNALLAKILLVVTSILNQGGSAGNYDLMGSLMGLAMGGTPSQINSNLTI